MISQLINSYLYVLKAFGQEVNFVKAIDDSVIKVLIAPYNRYNEDLNMHIEFNVQSFIISKNSIGDYKPVNGDRFEYGDKTYIVQNIETDFIGSKIVGYKVEGVPQWELLHL